MPMDSTYARLLAQFPDVENAHPACAALYYALSATTPAVGIRLREAPPLPIGPGLRRVRESVRDTEVRLCGLCGEPMPQTKEGG